MTHLDSILVIAERNGEVRSALQKACILARHFKARIDLFTCDSEHAYALRHTHDGEAAAVAEAVCIADSLRFLESLRQSIAARDLDISISAACASPEHDGIVRRLRDTCPDLVIKCVPARGERRAAVLSSADWQLIGSCSSPLMLTRGRPWAPVPRVIAAIDLSMHEPLELARQVVATAQFIAVGCNGQLDVLHSDSNSQAESRLRNVLAAGAIPRARLTPLHGDPSQTIAAFSAGSQADVIVLGALGSDSGAGSVVGRITEALVGRLEVDFVLIDPQLSALGRPARAAVAQLHG